MTQDTTELLNCKGINVDKKLTEPEIKLLVTADDWMMQALIASKLTNLPDWMIGAGFIRNKIWNHLHGFTPSCKHTEDIDLVYFDQMNISEEYETEIEERLKTIIDYKWSVKNMARMHLKNGDRPYASSTDGLAHWVETATCVAVKLNDDNQLELIAPYGIDDLVGLVLRPVPLIKQKMHDFETRITKKQWLQKWPKLKVVK